MIQAIARVSAPTLLYVAISLLVSAIAHAH
jgi:hypothetical protein